MKDLIERLEKATGPDRELDFLIGRALNDIPLHWRYSEGNILSTFDLLRNSECNYTSSIDAAVALVERVLPGWSWKIVGEPKAVRPHCAVLNSSGRLSDIAPTWVASHRTAPLAILTALLSTKGGV